MLPPHLQAQRSNLSAGSRGPFLSVYKEGPKPLPQTDDLTILGVDLGQMADYAAGSLLVKREYNDVFCGPRDPRIRCPAIRRWELGTDYTVIVDDILDLSPSIIAIEFNGVGRPVVDLLRRRALERQYRGVIRPIITAGSDARTAIRTEERGPCLVVPKIDIVTSINILQQSKQLLFAKTPEINLLFKEMQAFKLRYGTKTVTLAAEPGQHDDIVMSFGMACWYVVRFLRGATDRQRNPAIFM